MERSVFTVKNVGLAINGINQLNAVFQLAQLVQKIQNGMVKLVNVEKATIQQVTHVLNAKMVINSMVQNAQEFQNLSNAVN
jgi:hypothetical protein